MIGYGESEAYRAGLDDPQADADFFNRAKERFMSDEKMQGLALHHGISMDLLWHKEADEYMDENWEVI